MPIIPRKQPSLLANILAIIVLAVFIAATFVAVPLLALLVGMSIGQILAWFTGDYVVQAFNALGLTKVGSDDLPKVFGLLTLIAVLFTSKYPQKNKRKGDD